jgi:hypothetical protein
MSVEDAQIAAIAIQHTAALATRNVADFDFLVNLKLINPFNSAVSLDRAIATYKERSET